MERMTWTDERLEERFNGIDHRFDQVDQRFEQVDRRFDRVEGEIVELRREMHAGFEALYSTLNRGSIGIVVGLLGIIAAILAKGV
jgi:hypothetical protein